MDFNQNWNMSQILVSHPGIKGPIATQNDMLLSFYVGSEVISYTIWDITPCSLLKVNRFFGGTCRLYLQGRGINQGRNKGESWC
jgi:hypothetical protein